MGLNASLLNITLATPGVGPWITSLCHLYFIPKAISLSTGNSQIYNFILILSPEVHTHRFNCLSGYLIWVLNSLRPNLSLDFLSKPALSTVFHASVDVDSIFQSVKPKISESFLFPSFSYTLHLVRNFLNCTIQNLPRTRPLLLFSPSLPSPLLPFLCLPLPFLINRALKPSGVAEQDGVVA